MGEISRHNLDEGVVPPVNIGGEVEVEKNDIGKEGILESFMREMRNKYPDKEYYSIDEDLAEGKEIISYVVRNPEGGVEGVINGEKEQDGQFKVFWLITDPQYQLDKPAEKLWEKVFSEYDRIRLYSQVFGVERDATITQRLSRQQALIRYYKKLGFEQELGSESSVRPNGAIPMVWEKKKVSKK